ncbi:MAG: SCO family protein [Spirosomataceae bacterium]
MYRIVFLWLGSFCFFQCEKKQQEQLALPYYNTPDFTPLFIDNSVEISTKITHRIANFALLNQDSVWVTQQAIEGKIHVANFIFTSCPSICPTMTKNLKIVNDSLQNDEEVVLLSYSVTPWIDKTSVLKKYKTTHDIRNPRWHFLTGSKGTIYTLARQSYFAEEDLGFSKDSTEFLHTEHLLLIDKNKRIRGIYNGTLRLEMTQLLEDIHTLKQSDN